MPIKRTSLPGLKVENSITLKHWTAHLDQNQLQKSSYLQIGHTGNRTWDLMI